MNRKIFVVGITLFSMFFGAGNLIFAPWIGAQAGSAGFVALAGMMVTAVCMPIAALCVISLYPSAKDMAGRIWKPLGPLFMTLVYLLIGPCIAIPRTASTAMEMWSWLIDGRLAQTVCIFLFFLAACLMAARPGRLQDILGKVLGPLLLVLILFLSVPLLTSPESVAAPAGAYETAPFMTGLNEGYQTMDILAAFCFGSVIVLNIRQAHLENERRSLAQASVIAGVLLGAVYGLLGYAAIRHSGSLQVYSNGAQILSTAAHMSYGAYGQLLCAVIFLVACLNVCAGLLACTSQYFSTLITVLSYRQWLALFTVAGALMACTGLNAILSWSGRLLSLICPVAIVILLTGIVMHFKDKRSAV